MAEDREVVARAHQAGTLVFGRVLASLSEILIPVIVARLVGQADIAALMAIVLIYETIAGILTSGFPQALTYYQAGRQPGERRAVAWQTAKTLFVLGIVAGLLLAAIGLSGDRLSGLLSHANPADRVSLAPLVILALLPLGDLPSRMLPELLIVEGRAAAAAGVGIFRSAGMTLATVLPFAMGADIRTVAMWIVVFGGVRGLQVVYYLWKLYRHTAPAGSPASSSQLFHFAIPIGLTDLVSLLNGRWDRYLVFLAFGASVFVIYGFGAWQIPVLTTIPYAVGAAYAPRFVELFSSGRSHDAMAIWRRSVIKVALIVVPITAVFIVGAEETMRLLFTANYVGAAPIFRLYAILTLGRVAAYGTVIVTAGKPGYVFQASVLSLLANVALTVPLVWIVGYSGPALGTLLAFIPTVIFYCWCIGRAAGLHFREVFPLWGYLRVVGLTAVAAIGAVAFKIGVDAGAGLKLTGEGLILLAGFGVLGTALGVIERDDWRYLRDRVLPRWG